MPGHHDTHRPGLDTQQLALLSHEVRGALTVIVGMGELLRRELEPAERERALEGIARAVGRIDRLIQDAAAGELSQTHGRKAIDLATLVEEVVSEQRAVTGRSITFDAPGHPSVIGSRESLERAVGNLIDNALKYSLAASPVEIEVAEEAGRAVIRVADRGPGVAPGDRERIFEPFERAGGGAVEGTGLGLTVVRSVADAHGGTVGVHDRQSGGSVFSLELPVGG